MTAYVCVGIPSPFTYWCERVVAELVAASGAPAEIAAANTLEELAVVVLRSKMPHLVVGVRQMTPPLQVMLEATGKRFILVLDNPLSAFRLYRRNGEFDLAPVTRAIAWGCASMLRMGTMPGALRLHAVFDSNDAVALAMSIAEWFELNVDAETAARIVAQLPRPEIMPAEAAIEDVLSEFDPAQRAIIAGAVGGYVSWFAGHGLGQLIWARELFIHGDPPHRSVSGTVELTGRVRCLLFGPHIALPPGPWTATISLAFSKEAAGISYGIEWIAGQTFELTRMTLRPVSGGVFDASAVFAISGETEQPISLRITNERAAIDGQLALAQVAMTPLHVEKGEIPAPITTALGL